VGTKKTEEELTKSIFSTYSQFRNEYAPDRRQVYIGQLCDLIFPWCTNYLFTKKIEMGTDRPILEANNMGKEIFFVVCRIINMKDKTSIPEKETAFIGYLVNSLKKARLESIDNAEEDGVIHIPKGQRQKLKEINDSIRMEESELGRKLSEYEKVKKTAEWFVISEEVAREYLEKIIHMKSTTPLLSQIYDNDKEKTVDVLNTKEMHPNNQIISNNPVDLLDSKLNAQKSKEKLRETLASVFANIEEETKPYYKALFTTQCLEISDDTDKTGKIDNIKWLFGNFEWMQEYLDSDIIETFEKTKKIPTNKEIYNNFYPNPSKSPDQSASQLLRKFRDDLKTALEEYKKSEKTD